MTRPYLAELRIFITVKYKLQKREKHKKGGCHHHSKYISGGKITNHLQEKSKCLQLKWAAGLGGAKSRKIKTAILSLAPGMLAGLFSSQDCVQTGQTELYLFNVLYVCLMAKRLSAKLHDLLGLLNNYPVSLKFKIILATSPRQSLCSKSAKIF